MFQHPVLEPWNFCLTFASFIFVWFIFKTMYSGGLREASQEGRRLAHCLSCCRRGNNSWCTTSYKIQSKRIVNSSDYQIFSDLSILAALSCRLHLGPVSSCHWAAQEPPEAQKVSQVTGSQNIREQNKEAFLGLQSLGQFGALTAWSHMFWSCSVCVNHHFALRFPSLLPDTASFSTRMAKSLAVIIARRSCWQSHSPTVINCRHQRQGCI